MLSPCIAALLAVSFAAPSRPPAVPLAACDPYFSIWSFSDRLSDDVTRHWTGKPHGLTSLARIDGKPYRLMGPKPADVPALPQTGIEVLPTATICRFEGAGVSIVLTFRTPALPDELEVLSWPVTYISWELRSADGRDHDAAVYFDAAAEIAVNAPEQAVAWNREAFGAVAALRLGSRDQPVLGKKGDDLRIDWGYLYAAAPADPAARLAIAPAEDCRRRFAESGELPARDEAGPARPAREAPVLAMALPPVKAGAEPAVRWMMLAYDDLHSIEYFRQRLRPYWRRNGAQAGDLLQAAAARRGELLDRCRAFDDELMEDLRKAGGDGYARLGALAYRQCLAANKLAADAAGYPLLFPKENFSNGCIATMDVIYPMEPMFLLLSPSLVKASLAPILDYAASDRWTFPFAPHDLGTYPLANGQVYGGGERTEDDQMPVEESGNMLLLLAALARIEGNADFAAGHWPALARWAEYLRDKGFDPENQLCTDDFAGHLAHNVNLSAKAILALGAYARLAEMLGKADEASSYRKLAREFAARWIREADDGDFFRLAFDKKGSWSQKYNLVWDRLLGLDLFPAAVFEKEMAHYRKVQNRYGLPLDSRKEYTKLDWIVWTACLTGKREDFDALIAPIGAFLDETPDRVPMTDWYQTRTARKAGFQARSVVGGVFIRLLDGMETWKKWAGRDRTVLGKRAPIPPRPVVRTVVPASQGGGIPWEYTFENPGAGWFRPDFTAAGWKQGPAGFGTRGTPGGSIRTEWRTADIWLRRRFELKQADAADSGLHLLVHHDEDVEIYINGVLAATATGFTTSYEPLPMTDAGRAALKAGGNLLAVRCHQTGGGQYIDVGLAVVK